MRPMYESQEDRNHEKVVVEKLCQAWKCVAKKNPAAYQIDWSLSVGKEVKALVEIKYRTASYPTYILSLHKYTYMVQGAKATGVPHLLVICWPEEGKRVIRWMSIQEGSHNRVVHGGRTDRGDSQDQEPMVEIDSKKFKLLGEV